MQSLPIDSLLPEIVRSLGHCPNLVIEAPPGAGKTTRVPAALLEAGLAGGGEVWVLEPRRLAARMAARRVAEERGERVGETVGYQVRFEEVSGPRTRLRFLTEGVLTRRLLSDPQLSGVGTIILDEFHERHLQGDLALALLRRLQLTARPELRTVVMSATLDAAPIARFLGDCPQLRSAGRRFEVELEHLARPDERPLAAQVEGAVRRLVDGGLAGDVLVFLPGAAEIRRAQEACAPLAAGADLLILPLHGELTAAQQDLAVRPAARRKVILSTNVAESSITIEGVFAVIDSGLARVASHSPWSGLPVLGVGRVSRAAAIQRAGRAGRTGPGRALRLYTAQDFAARPEYEAPEIERLDLAETALELHAAGVRDLHRFEWYEAPQPEALETAGALLRRLGALDAAGQLTPTGERMLHLPLHPRLSRMVIEGERRGVARQACLVAALIGERDIRAANLLADPRQRPQPRPSSSPSDLLELFDLFLEAERAHFAPERLSAMGLNPNSVRAVERARRQLQSIVEGIGMKGTGGVRADGSDVKKARGAGVGEGLSTDAETKLLISILSGYPDRVARRRGAAGAAEAGEVEVLLAGGGAATLAPESVVRQAEFLVAVEAEERRRPGLRGRGRGGAVVRLASAIEPEWLLDLFTDALRETGEVQWNAQAERVETVRRLMYDQLVLDESRASGQGGEEEARVLAAAALEAGPEAFVEGELIERFLARVEFVARSFPEAGLQSLDAEDVQAALAAMCAGRRSFAELRQAAQAGALLEGLRRKLTPEQSRLLSKMAPERVTLAGGRQVRVNYERRQPPWIASRLQDFFGMREGPKVAGGRVALVLHLLAPSQRPVQVTTDLPGFWERHYPQVRRELGRRYPRHAWPEDPLGPPVENRRKG
ncbi:MAG TPA: ATP-dependent helicase C-terminal domain-containing protein [Pyrinomonadaceae bacterium]|jgi:ATP-dependent helicase HrpB